LAWRYPHLLWLIIPAAGLTVAYVAVLRARRRPHPVRFHADPLRQAMAAAGRRRHLPATLLILGVLLAVIAASGPIVPLPTSTGTPVVLIIDVSRSMEETDIAPTRIHAAIVAGVEFARRLPRASRVSVVTFGSFASVVVPLTADRARVIAGIEGLTTQLRTQLGTGLVEGVRAVTGEGDLPGLPPSVAFRAIAVLLSDGRASDGVPPEEAAQTAKTRGVRVHTVGLGTAADPSTFRSGYFGVLDEPTLRMIADHTGGRYFRAEEAGRLREIYRDLARMIGWTRSPTDVSAVAATAAMILLVAAVLLRLRHAPLS
jgi:Ca-activated chloride channel family protein